MVTALRFFLSSDESKDDSEDSDSDDVSALYCFATKFLMIICRSLN